MKFRWKYKNEGQLIFGVGEQEAWERTAQKCHPPSGSRPLTSNVRTHERTKWLGIFDYQTWKTYVCYSKIPSHFVRREPDIRMAEDGIPMEDEMDRSLGLYKEAKQQRSRGKKGYWIQLRGISFLVQSLSSCGWNMDRVSSDGEKRIRSVVMMPSASLLWVSTRR